MAARAPFIEIWRAKNGQWYGHRKARNGRVTGTAGEGYGSKSGVTRWAERNYPDVEVRLIEKA